ncbi:unnamed protein product [Vicia faba]|uniref:Uncharacterized protein n=1 Tax=Vicia faba TaxID=3906 RepID=A0AAV1B6I9_VICFA|nr:unnamed protein product [Vicia faba]
MLHDHGVVLLALLLFMPTNVILEPMQFSCIRSRIGLDKRARNIVVIDHVTFNTFPISHNCFSIEAQQKNFDSVEENHVDIMEELSKRGMPHAEHELEIIEMNYKVRNSTIL